MTIIIVPSHDHICDSLWYFVIMSQDTDQKKVDEGVRLLVSLQKRFLYTRLGYTREIRVSLATRVY